MKNLQLQKLNSKLLEQWGPTLLTEGSIKLSTIGNFESLEVEVVRTKAIVKITQDGDHTNVGTNADLNDDFLFHIIGNIIDLAYDVFIKQEEEKEEEVE